MKKLLLCILLLFASQNGLRAQEVITGETIVTMLKEQFSEHEIISFIESSDFVQIEYNLQLLRQLKEAGATEQLITYLLNMKAKQKESAKAEELQAIDKLNGVYWHPKPDSAVIIPYNICTMMNKALHGFGVVESPVIHNYSYAQNYESQENLLETLSRKKFESLRLSIGGAQASIKVDTRPTFRFYLNRTVETDEWFCQWFATVANPNEFQCVRLTPIKKKKARVFPEGLKFCEDGIDISCSEQSAIDCIVEFNVRQYDETTYEVTFPQKLSPGEYCFFYKNLSNEKLRGRLVVFDFSVK